MRPHRHTSSSPIRCWGEYKNYEPALCACGVLINIRTGKQMTPLQIEAWVAEQVDQRIHKTESHIYFSEAMA